MTMALCKARSRVTEDGNSSQGWLYVGGEDKEEGVFVTSWSGNS